MAAKTNSEDFSRPQDEPQVAAERRAAALRERDKAVQERDVALKQRDSAVQERDSAFKERNLAVWGRDTALREVIAARDRSNSWRLTAPFRAGRVLLRRLRSSLGEIALRRSVSGLRLDALDVRERRLGDLEADSGGTGRILILDHNTPTPDRDAGSAATLNLMRLLVGVGYQVTFVPESNFQYLPGYTTALEQIGIEVLYAPGCTSVKAHLQADGRRYDGVIMIRPLVAERHLEDIGAYCTGARRIYLAADLHFLRMQREAHVVDSPETLRDAGQMRDRELSIMKRCHATVVHSSYEARFLAKDFGIENTHVFKWPMEVLGTEAGFESRKDICFIGSYTHSPNVDAVQYFVREVLPLIRTRLPDVLFYIVGNDPPESFRELGEDGAVVAGFVEQLNPFLDKIRVAVAPLRFGAGTKGKISTTLAAGLPCVATSVAAEGMGLTDGKNVLLADSIDAFVARVVELYTSPSKWRDISVEGIEFARQSYSFERGTAVVKEILRQAGMKASIERAAVSTS